MDASQPQAAGVQTPPTGEKNTGMAVIAYLLFFVPLLTGEKSEFVKYHTNQGIVLFLFSVAVSVVGTVVPLLGWFLILPVGTIMVLVFLVMGILNAINGEMKPLPLIGKYQLLK